MREIGERLERRWRSENYDERAFVELAAEILEESNLHEGLTPSELLSWRLFTPSSERDSPAPFGQPPITLFRGERFFVEALLWLDGAPHAHQHCFSGAFQVLAGSSIHTQYDFEQTRRISSAMLVGRVVRRSTEYLQRGDVRRIESGSSFTHSLFHLDQPSLSLVVRTYEERDALPQYTYYPPFFAHDTLRKRGQTEVRLKCLASMRCFDPEYDSVLERFVRELDFEDAFFAIRQDLRLSSFDLDRLAHLTDVLRERHGELADMTQATLEEDVRLGNITSRRHSITNTEHRFFLALLMNLGSSEEILEAVETRYPADPRATVMRWVRELTLIDPGGGVELLEIQLEREHETGFAFDTMLHAMFELLLDKSSVSDAFAALSRQFGSEAIESEAEGVRALYDTLKSSMSFGALFR